MLSWSTFSCSPAFGWDPYPIGTTYLQTVAWRKNLSDAGRPPSVRRWHVSRKSSSKIGRTFIDSGSANRTLNSRSLSVLRRHEAAVQDPLERRAASRHGRDRLAHRLECALEILPPDERQ